VTPPQRSNRNVWTRQIVSSGFIPGTKILGIGNIAFTRQDAPAMGAAFLRSSKYPAKGKGVDER